jgi:hypothetical protein
MLVHADGGKDGQSPPERRHTLILKPELHKF